MMNPVGFFFYVIYNAQGTVNSSIGLTGEIESNDVFFGIHAYTLAVIQFSQCLMYERGEQKSINWWVVSFIALQFVIIFTMFGVEISIPGRISQDAGTIRLCGYCKAAITFVKYIPQVLLNYRRQSTVGFSLINVSLDFAGGLSSLAQQIIGSVALGKPFLGGDDAAGFNIVKFLLSVLSIIFDLIFFFQHYCLYRQKWQEEQLFDDRLDKLTSIVRKMNSMKGSTDGDTRKPLVEGKRPQLSASLAGTFDYERKFTTKGAKGKDKNTTPSHLLKRAHTGKDK